MTPRELGTDARERITKRLITTAYMVRAQAMPDEIVEFTVNQLCKFPETWVIGALDRCCMELKTQRGNRCGNQSALSRAEQTCRLCESPAVQCRVCRHDVQVGRPIDGCDIYGPE